MITLMIKSLYHSLLQLECWDHWCSSCRICMKYMAWNKVCIRPLMHFWFLHQAHHQRASAFMKLAKCAIYFWYWTLHLQDQSCTFDIRESMPSLISKFNFSILKLRIRLSIWTFHLQYRRFKGDWCRVQYRVRCIHYEYFNIDMDVSWRQYLVLSISGTICNCVNFNIE